MYCCVPGCRKRPGHNKSTSRNLASPRLSFHKLPSDPHLLRALIIRIKRDQDPNFRVTHHTRICSLHYTPEDFYVFNSVKRELRPGVLPSIFNFNGSLSEPEPLPKKKVQQSRPQHVDLARQTVEQHEQISVKLEQFLEEAADAVENDTEDDLHDAPISTEYVTANLEHIIKLEEPRPRPSLLRDGTAEGSFHGWADGDYIDNDDFEFVSLTSDQPETAHENPVVVSVKVEDQLADAKLGTEEESYLPAVDHIHQMSDPLSQHAVQRCISPEGIRKHSPKPCRFCGAVFRTKNEVWKAHMKLHLTDKEHLHGCNICGKYFFSSYVLMRHKQAHMERLSSAVSQGRVVSQSEEATSSQSEAAPKKVMKKFKILVPVELLSTGKPRC